jgi:hypothetical protein
LYQLSDRTRPLRTKDLIPLSRFLSFFLAKDRQRQAKTAFWVLGEARESGGVEPDPPSWGGARTNFFVSLAERVVTIRQGKGGKRREVPIRRDLAQLPWLHIGTRRAGPLFVSRQEGSGPTPHVLTRQRVGQMVRAVAVAAGISKRVYPHLLRHTVATRLLELGMDITDLQRFLGHQSITTTRLYAETTATTLRRRFDQLTDPAAHALVAGIR